MVAKPSEFTPVTAAMLGEICSSAGLPNGVLNIVNGLGGSVGQAIVEHPKIKAISFTGGTVTGKHIASVTGPMFKKVSLELGGKNPNIIFADADMDKAIKTTHAHRAPGHLARHPMLSRQTAVPAPGVMTASMKSRAPRIRWGTCAGLKPEICK